VPQAATGEGRHLKEALGNRLGTGWGGVVFERVIVWPDGRREIEGGDAKGATGAGDT
jgi:hypothetical protein